MIRTHGALFLAFLTAIFAFVICISLNWLIFKSPSGRSTYRPGPGLSSLAAGGSSGDLGPVKVWAGNGVRAVHRLYWLRGAAKMGKGGKVKPEARAVCEPVMYIIFRIYPAVVLFQAFETALHL